MVHRWSKHKLSLKNQKHEARNLIHKYSRIDYFKSEKINILTPSEIKDHLKDKFEFLYSSVYNKFCKGEVITDAYGKGSFQQPQLYGR